jgi:hypothetical protein
MLMTKPTATKPMATNAYQGKRKRRDLTGTALRVRLIELQGSDAIPERYSPFEKRLNRSSTIIRVEAVISDGKSCSGHLVWSNCVLFVWLPRLILLSLSRPVALLMSGCLQLFRGLGRRAHHMGCGDRFGGLVCCSAGRGVRRGFGRRRRGPRQPSVIHVGPSVFDGGALPGVPHQADGVLAVRLDAGDQFSFGEHSCLGLGHHYRQDGGAIGLSLTRSRRCSR